MFDTMSTYLPNAKFDHQRLEIEDECSAEFYRMDESEAELW